jgi:hypothetical protein
VILWLFVVRVSERAQGRRDIIVVVRTDPAFPSTKRLPCVARAGAVLPAYKNGAGDRALLFIVYFHTHKEQQCLLSMAMPRVCVEVILDGILFKQY